VATPEDRGEAPCRSPELVLFVRWGDINLGRLHPLNQDEVVRLLDVVDADGIKSLSPRDRLFLDNMTLPRMGV
jgi:hypothetical protein